jgi:hypothetical protein
VKAFLQLEKSVDVNEHSPWSHALCGELSELPQHRLFSTGHAAVLEFHTDHKPGNHSGFLGTFRFLDRSEYSLILQHFVFMHKHMFIYRPAEAYARLFKIISCCDLQERVKKCKHLVLEFVNFDAHQFLLCVNSLNGCRKFT